MVIIEAIMVTALAQKPSQTPTRDWRVGDFVQQDTTGWLSESLVELDAFLNDVEMPTNLRLTLQAYLNARQRLIDTSALLSSKPELILDGDGGIDIEWMKDGRLLMYACRANPDQRNYIYFQSGAAYGGKDYSSIYSTDRLNWLLNG